MEYKDPAQEKKRLREEVCERVLSMPNREEANRKLCEAVVEHCRSSYSTVVGFLQRDDLPQFTSLDSPLRAEPDISEALLELHNLGVEILLPEMRYIDPSDQTLTYDPDDEPIWGGDGSLVFQNVRSKHDLDLNRLKQRYTYDQRFLSVNTRKKLVDKNIIWLLPCIGWNRSDRGIDVIGTGRGGNDGFMRALRWMAHKEQVPSPSIVGCGYEEGRCHVPIEDHDRPLDGILTDAGGYVSSR